MKDAVEEVSALYFVSTAADGGLHCLDGWQYAQLGDGVDLLSGNHVMASCCNNQGIGTPYLTGPADFPNGVIQLTKYTTRPSAICDAGDILITVKGSGVGSLTLADTKYCISRQLMAVRVRNWDERFVYQLISSKQDFFSGAATGLIPGLSRGDILEKSIHIPVDPEEQTAIADALSNVDALINGLENLIAKKQAIKTATMQQLLTGRTQLPQFATGPDGCPRGTKQTELGEIPEDWDLLSLGDVCIFENGDRGSNYPSPNSFVGSGVPFINAGHIANGVISLDCMNYITDEAYSRLGGGKVRPGDILFCLRGSLGKYGLVSENFGLGAIASSLVIVRAKERVSLQYLICYFASELCEKMIELWAGGAAQPNLGARELARFALPVPKKDEQTAIASILSDIDGEIQTLEQRLSKTRQIKQGMMQELLTGRTRLV